MNGLDVIDRAIVAALQSGLPPEVEPWEAVGRKAGLAADLVLARVDAMIEAGVIRRIAAAPNHYKLGLVANGMSVWDVEDSEVDAIGARVAALDFVSHCYRRPRRLPHWPFNLFAMLHGATRNEVEKKRVIVRSLIGAACGSDDILYSTKILKKTGFRLAG